MTLRRYAIAGASLALILALHGLCIWARFLPRLHKIPLLLVFTLTVILVCAMFFTDYQLSLNIIRQLFLSTT
jgi:hypothetical protein